MSRIPDCRTDEAYNQKYLKEKDAEFVAGMDWCRIMAVDTFFENLEIYTGEFESDDNGFNLMEYLEEHEDVRQSLRDCLFHCIEMERDELITSMIEHMDDKEYETLKAKADQGDYQNCLETYPFEADDKE